MEPEPELEPQRGSAGGIIVVLTVVAVAIGAYVSIDTSDRPIPQPADNGCVSKLLIGQHLSDC